MQEKVIETENEKEVLVTTPSVYNYIDFKVFLKDYYLFKKKAQPGFSFGQFAKLARIATRNYLKRVIDGERPLSNENLPKFIMALNFEPKEAAYFEALVHYSQAKDLLIKKYYFEQLRNASIGVKGSYLDVHSGQYEIFQNWFTIPIYEYFSLPEASQDAKVIVKHFRDKISLKDVKESIELLLTVGLLEQEADTQRIRQKIENIRYENNILNMAVRNYHLKMLEMTMQEVQVGDVEDRYLRATSISVASEFYDKVKKEIEEFMTHLNQKYSVAIAEKNSIVQFNSQLIKLTNVVKGEV